MTHAATSPTRRRPAGLVTAVLAITGTLVAPQQTLVVPLLPCRRGRLGMGQPYHSLAPGRRRSSRGGRASADPADEHRLGLRRTVDVRQPRLDHAHTGNNVIIHGHVRGASGHPARSAVTTLLTDTGEEVDWSRVEPDGSYSLVLPGPVVYQRITNADGYQPRAELVRIDKPGAYDVELGPRLELTGLVRLEGRPVSDASTTVTTASGEVELTTTAGPDGRFAVRLGVTGRHVVSVIDPSTGASRSCHVVVLGSVAPLVVDLEPVSALTVDA